MAKKPPQNTGPADLANSGPSGASAQKQKILQCTIQHKLTKPARGLATIIYKI
jgi:hypothetical protein